MIKPSCLAAALLLAGCAAPRLQKPYEAFNELGKTNQAQMEAQCGNAGQQTVDCRRRVRDEFEALRRKNEQEAR